MTKRGFILQSAFGAYGGFSQSALVKLCTCSGLGAGVFSLTAAVLQAAANSEMVRQIIFTIGFFIFFLILSFRSVSIVSSAPHQQRAG
jgi:hypothetical protein